MPPSPRRRLLRRALRWSGTLRPEVVVFDVTHRCNATCVGCGFRQAEDGELGAGAWVDLGSEAHRLGFREVLITGGEPLMRADIEALMRGVASWLTLDLHTNGSLLARHAKLVRDTTRTVYVSVDAADPEVFRALRGLGLGSVWAGIEALGGQVPVHARVTVWAQGVGQLGALLDAMAEHGVQGASLLAPDVGSAGFGARGDPASHAPAAHQLEALAQELHELATHPILQQSRSSLDRVVHRLRALHGIEAPVAPFCLAPFTSGIVGPTGVWQPCFFIEADSGAGGSLSAQIRAGRKQRRSLDVSAHTTCQQCVCWRG